MCSAPWLALVGAPLTAPAQTAMPPGAVANVSFPGKDTLELKGRLYRPTDDGPSPAVVLLHGCAGVMLMGASMDRVIVPALDSGYVVLVVDSLAPRHVDSICADPLLVCANGQPLGVQSPTARERADDAFAAQRFLSSVPFVDSGRIGLIGWSHGGIAALRAWERNVVVAGRAPFAAIAAYYPCCAREASEGDEDVRATRVPLAIFIGDLDDWCPATFCRSFMARETASGRRDLSLTVYPGATHSFDGVGGSSTYLGHKLAPDPAATRDSHERLFAFLDRMLKRP